MGEIKQAGLELPGEVVMGLLEHARDIFAFFDRDLRYFNVTRGWRKTFGLNDADVGGRCAKSDLAATLDLPDPEAFFRSIVAGEIEKKVRIQLKSDNGKGGWVDLMTQPWTSHVNGSQGLVITLYDVTAKLTTEDELLISNDRLKEAQRLARIGDWDWDLVTDIVSWSDPIYEMWGYDRASKPSLTYADYFSGVAEDEKEAVSSWINDALNSNGRLNYEHQVVRPDGTTRVVAINGRVETNADNVAVRLIGVAQDVSARRSLEEQLQHSQKMEATGRLAGGVAHDFNNILTAIFSFAAFAKQGLEKTHPSYEDIEEVLRAAEQAKSLTAQLLAFSRRKTVAPKVINLNKSVGNADAMMRRLLGEDIMISSALNDDLWNTRIDPDAFEQVIINFAVNARDAMPQGGRLTLKTDNVHLGRSERGGKGQAIPAGDYVVLVLSDDGEGMTEEIRAQIFEPFFTTKPQGEGTGLGLSTCYGIVRQAGGYIWVDSERGRGTTFKVFLPRIHVETESTKEPSRDDMVAGNESVLVVEDNAQVRAIAERTLREFGYTVAAAASGKEALQFLEHAKRVPDLLVTDVVMPNMSGKQLADLVGEKYPAMRVLFISGYSEKTIVHHGVLESGIELLQKPFQPQDLGVRVQQVLIDGEPWSVTMRALARMGPVTNA